MPYQGQKITLLTGTFLTGSNLDVDATAEQLTATQRSFSNGIIVKAALSNTGTVYIGPDAGVTAGTLAATDGFPLDPGDSVFLEMTDPSLIYCIGSAANQKVFWIGA